MSLVYLYLRNFSAAFTAACFVMKQACIINMMSSNVQSTTPSGASMTMLYQLRASPPRLMGIVIQQLTSYAFPISMYMLNHHSSPCSHDWKTFKSSSPTYAGVGSGSFRDLRWSLGVPGGISTPTHSWIIVRMMFLILASQGSAVSIVRRRSGTIVPCLTLGVDWPRPGGSSSSFMTLSGPIGSVGVDGFWW